MSCVSELNALNDAVALIDARCAKQFRLDFKKGDGMSREYNAWVAAYVSLTHERDQRRRLVGDACAPWFE